MAYGQPKMMADVDPYLYGSASGEYEERLRQARNVFGPQAQNQQGQVTTGAEGQMWQGIAQAQEAGQMAAGRRGYNPLAARAAGQAGAEMQQAGYGQAAGLRAADEAARRQAELQVLQGRSQYETQMGQLGTQAMGQALQQREFEAQMAEQRRLAEEQQSEAIKQGFMGLGSAALGAVAMSDENAKQGMRMANDEDIMGTLGNIAYSGEWANPKNPRTATVFVGDPSRLRKAAPAAAAPAAAASKSVEDMTEDERSDEIARLLGVTGSPMAKADERDVYAEYEAEEADRNARRAAELGRLGLAPASGVMAQDIGGGGPEGYGRLVPAGEVAVVRPTFRPEVATRPAMPVEVKSFGDGSWLSRAAEINAGLAPFRAQLAQPVERVAAPLPGDIARDYAASRQDERRRRMTGEAVPTGELIGALRQFMVNRYPTR
jgi:hypothetical protein